MGRRGSSFFAAGGGAGGGGDAGDGWRPPAGWAVPGVGVSVVGASGGAAGRVEPEAVGLPGSPIAVGDWSAEQALAGLPVVLGAIAGAAWWRCGEAELRERIALLGRAENQIVAAQVAVTGEALQRRVLVGSGFTSGGAWWRGLVALTPGAAAQRARLAEELAGQDLAPTKDAFTAGDLNVGQASAVTRTMGALDAVPAVDATTRSEAQQLLLAEARRLDARQHCTFPGCAAPPAWCHAHHLVPFGRHGRPGGPTSEANGTMLCARHHRLVHAQGWTGHLVDGHVHWQPPQPGAPPAQPNDRVRQIETKLRRLAQRWLSRNPQLHDTG